MTWRCMQQREREIKFYQLGPYQNVVITLTAGETTSSVKPTRVNTTNYYLKPWPATRPVSAINWLNFVSMMSVSQKMFSQQNGSSWPWAIPRFWWLADIKKITTDCKMEKLFIAAGRSIKNFHWGSQTSPNISSEMS